MNRHLEDYAGRFYKNIISRCETYGIDHRTPFNHTPLMLAARAGNAPLVGELLAAGADADLTDNYGRTAWHGALERALTDREYAAKEFGAVHEALAPSHVSLKADDRLIKLDASQGEYLLFGIFFSLLHRRFSDRYAGQASINAVHLAKMTSLLPDSVVPEYRKKRAYISALLSKNEIGSANPFSRKLFRRERQGWYIINPGLAVFRKDEWIDVYRYAGIDLISRMDPDGPGAYFESRRLLLDAARRPPS